jgi:hypothetical protein
MVGAVTTIADGGQDRSEFSRRLDIPRQKIMSKLLMTVVVVVGLSACHGGISGGIAGNGQGSTPVAANAWQSAVAQASIGTMGAVELTAD